MISVGTDKSAIADLAACRPLPEFARRWHRACRVAVKATRDGLLNPALPIHAMQVNFLRTSMEAHAVRVGT